MLMEEVGRLKQESQTNEQLVKQFLMELKTAKQKQREMEQREEKLLSVLRRLAGSAIQPLGHEEFDSALLDQLQPNKTPLSPNLPPPPSSCYTSPCSAGHQGYVNLHSSVRFLYWC